MHFNIVKDNSYTYGIKVKKQMTEIIKRKRRNIVMQKYKNDNNYEEEQFNNNNKRNTRRNLNNVQLITNKPVYEDGLGKN